MKRDFNNWFSEFKENIADYKYYTDFDKVYKNVESIKVELNILNSLIGSKNIEQDFKNLFKKYPEIIKALPILIAKREKEIFCQDENGGVTYTFDFGNTGQIVINSKVVKVMFISCVKLVFLIYLKIIS